MQSELELTSTLDLKVIRSSSIEDEILDWKASNLPYMERGLFRVRQALQAGIPTFIGTLGMKILRANGDVLDLDIVSYDLVTTAGVNKIVALMNGTDAVTGAAFKYHALGNQASPTSPANADTALQAELTTQYNPDNTRATGTQTTGGSNNIYQTVGTNTVDATVAATEWGCFSAATGGTGTLLDRVTYSTVNLSSGDSLQTTFNLTFAAGG